MGRNHLRLLSAPRGRPARRRSRIRSPRSSRRPRARRDAKGYLEPQAMLARRTSMPSSSPPRRRPTSRSRSPRSSAAIAALIEKPLAATPDEADRIVRALRRDRRPDPGRPRRAVQPRGPRARPAARRRLAVDRLLDRQPSSRPVPGAHPRCRRDDRPRHPRRRHPVVRSPPSDRSASRRRRRSASTRTTRTCCSA